MLTSENNDIPGSKGKIFESFLFLDQKDLILANTEHTTEIWNLRQPNKVISLS